MSLENLKEYGRRAATDDTVKARAKAIGLQDMSRHMEYASSLGLDFDQDDVNALAKEAQGSEELSEDQLETVAGGIVSATAAVVAGVVGAAAGVVGAGAAVTSTTTGRGW
jgi:predicted ribosomally synthesized peptide with nif11-like leader